ncbi:MAG: hypothetical protein JSS86_02600 [Cyanobacteria bacterium SZAS LIN-2]|nr:hypothetical protein [Cyanobacteria bacterium SZAS LIN-2]MBS2009515.1 hypothetical protein [Cyanobacteria bacterium SZAS TMP-1]
MMSSDHDHDHSTAHGDSHGGHDDHPPAADAFPVNSLQDQALKLVTLIGAFLLIGAFGGWWYFQALPVVGEGHGEGHGAVESVEH